MRGAPIKQQPIYLVLGRANWYDSTIQKILENEIYKGDFVHGKRTKNPTYYKGVVEPLVSKELWEECQVQKKKNSRSYKRTLEYLFLQKLRCPKCNRILGGKATTKKNGKAYFYYYCNDCELTIKESEIEKESEHAEELLLQMKSKKELYKDIEQVILDNHSYETPQLIAYDIVDGYKGYLNWIKKIRLILLENRYNIVNFSIFLIGDTICNKMIN